MGKDPPPDDLAERADLAVEEARQWNRDLRNSVKNAKANAKALSDSRNGNAPDTPKRP